MTFINIKLSKLALPIIFVISVGIIRAQNSTQVEVHQNSSNPVISKHIYGHFAEHLGRCIYGGFYVGEDSSIPNTNGVRNDIIEALRALKIPNLRWPGGCFADTYHWKDGVGPKENRPAMVNKWWGNVVEDNSFGTHDFLNLCETLEAEPYLAANVGSSTVKEFTEYIQYVTRADGVPMSDYRIQNGRKAPWQVKYWGVGNEMWGCGGNMTPNHYANIYKQYATFMTDWNNSDNFFRIASGANVADYNWTEVLMREIPKNLLEGVALHSYSFVEWHDKGSSTQFDEAQYFSTMQTALKMDMLIKKHTEIMDKYDPEHKVALIVDEWGGWYDVEPGTNPGFLYQQNTMRDAMIAGSTLNIFNNWAERVKMANLAQTVNVLQAVILTDDEKMLLTPTYHVMKMYNVHHDATLLPLTFESPTYRFEEQELPAISISASQNENNETHFSIVNIDAHNTNSVEINVANLDIKKVSAKILTAEKLQDHNTFDQPNRIEPSDYEGLKLKKGTLKVDIPPFSVVVIKGQ